MRMLFFIAAIAAIADAQDPTGGVTGIVRDAVSHQPLKKAMVTVNPTQFMGAQTQNFGPKSATTDVSGTFSIDNLPAGKYQLTVQHQNYPQGRMGAIRKTVAINAGEKAGPIEVELIPPGTISGRILDEDGDPLNGCFAQAHPAAHPEQGAQGGPGTQGAVEAGEYRLYGIPAGKYVLTARCGQPPFQPRPFSAGPDPPPSLAYPLQYYPLALDAKSAQVIELTPGSERSGVDFRMKPSPVTFVRVALSPAGSDARNLMAQLIPAETPRIFGIGSGARPNATDNTLVFQQVFPGSYFLAAVSNGENQLSAMQRIEVKDQPVETVLELKPAIDISGTVQIEGDPQGKIPLNQLQIFLAPELPMGGMRQTPTAPEADGSFTLKSVTASQWHIQVNGPNVFLKSATIGSTDVTDKVLDLSSGAAGPLKLIVSANGGVIRGTAPAGYQVFITPVAGQQFGGMNVAGADQNGQYKFTFVKPGVYRIAAMEAGGEVPEDAKQITVREGETVTVDVKPSAQF